MTNARLSTLVLLLVALPPAVSRADVGLLRTAHALDEARGYCLDIAGFGATLRLDDPLQAHTCKYGSQLDDQRFEPGRRLGRSGGSENGQAKGGENEASVHESPGVIGWKISAARL